MRFLLKSAAFLLLLVLGGAAYISLSHQPEEFPAGSRSAERLQSGPFTVESFSETFIDRSRETPAHGDYEGAPQRTLKGDVWYPAEAEAVQRPLLVFSHGFTSSRRNGVYLAEHLASHGFVVVAVDYPLTSYAAPGGALLDDVVNQPGDVSFLIDTLLGYSRVSGHALSGKLDPGSIGAFGISLGGLTSTLVGFHPQWRDPRVAAVLSIAGPTSFFTPAFFSQRLPFLMLAGELDALVPYASNAAPIPAKMPGAELVTVAGGSHTGFSGGAALLRAMKNTDALGCFSVMRYIDEDAEGASWAGMLGSAEQGIDYSVENELCKVDPLPRAMNVLRQHMIALVVIRAFFESTLSPEPEVRAAAERYLQGRLAQEIDEVRYERSLESPAQAAIPTMPAKPAAALAAGA